MSETAAGLLAKARKYELIAQRAADREMFEIYHQAAVETRKLAKAAASLEAAIRPQPRPPAAAPARRRPMAGSLAKSHAGTGRPVLTPGTMIYMTGLSR
jgi:hypothetical protein